MTDEERAIWERRRQRALRWADKATKGYPTIGRIEDETDDTLNAEPPEDTTKKKTEAQQ